MRGGWRACADRCARREQACLHLQPTHSCPALDSLLHSAAGSTASAASIGGAVAVVFFVVACSYFRRFGALLAAAGGSRGSLWSSKAATWSCKAACKVARRRSARQLSLGGSGGPRARLLAAIMGLLHLWFTHDSSLFANALV